MSKLRLYAYNVRFGDALLLAVPDREGRRERIRHILIDVGNVLAGRGGPDELFAAVVEDILEKLDGRPLDLYVMTHEHLDHVQGLLAAKTRFGLEIPVRYSWLTASASPSYQKRYPEARRRLELLRHEYERIHRRLTASGASPPRRIRSLLENNNPARTGDCVSYLRELATTKTSFVHRGFRIRAGVHHPFREARFSIWAPEADTSTYYGRFRPLLLGSPLPGETGTPDLSELEAPEGVDPEAFDGLLASLGSGLGDNLLAIDRAANNTSIVFCLHWRGWKLLFPGDAETRSWLTMHKEGKLEPVHFLKLAHHGSHNGTPSGELLEAILPRVRPDSRPRSALLSTCTGTYGGVPHRPTRRRIKRRVDELHSTQRLGAGKCLEMTFDGRESQSFVG